MRSHRPAAGSMTYRSVRNAIGQPSSPWAWRRYGSLDLEACSACYIKFSQFLPLMARRQDPGLPGSSGSSPQALLTPSRNAVKLRENTNSRASYACWPTGGEAMNCGNCGAAKPAEARFCGRCGSQLTYAGPDPVAPPAPAGPTAAASSRRAASTASPPITSPTGPTSGPAITGTTT